MSRILYYCGECNWTKLGCDRIDNAKGHTKDNVITACWECNDLRGRMKLSVEDFYKFKNG